MVLTSDQAAVSLSPRDASSVEATGNPNQPLRPVTGARAPGFQVVLKRSVLNAIHIHGQSTRELEVCGVLVGGLYRDEAGPFLYVEAAVRGEHASNLAAQVTFTSETWTHIHTVMEKQYPDRKILGWYHTHPGFGIFLSGMDLFIHENFFGLPWQVAFVYDPLSGEQGMFVWRGGQPVREPCLIEEDAMSDTNPAALGEFAVLSERVRTVERRQRWMTVGLVLVALLALAWPIVWPRVMPYFRPEADETPPSRPAHVLPDRSAKELPLTAPAAPKTLDSIVISAIGQAGDLPNLWPVGWVAKTMHKAETPHPLNHPTTVPR